MSRRGRGAAAVLGALLLLGTSGFAQKSLIEGEVEVRAEPWSLEVPPVQAPTLLVIKGRVDRGDLDIRLDGCSVGLLSDFGLVFGLPLESRPSACSQPRGVEVVPAEGGGILTAVTLEPAGVLEVEVFSETPRRRLAAFVHFAALDGRDVPSFGRRPELRLWGRALLCPSGRGRLLVPAQCTATLVAAATPFYTSKRRQVRVSAGRRIGARFLLAGRGLPPGATITAGTAEGLPDIGQATRELLDCVQGITRRRSDLPVFASALAELVPQEFGSRLLEADQLPPILIGPWWDTQLPDSGCRPLRSVRLATGAWLHTNGPIIEVPPILRSGTTADPLGSVVATIRLDFDADIVPAEVIVSTREGVIVQQPVAKPETLRLPLVLRPETRVLVQFRGERFARAPQPAPPPLAWRTFLVP